MKTFLVRSTVFVVALAGLDPAHAIVRDRTTSQKPGLETMPMIDARVNLKSAVAQSLAARPALESKRRNGTDSMRAVAEAVAAVRAAKPSWQIEIDAHTMAPTTVSSLAGPLTDAAPGESAETVVRNFLRRQGAMYGIAERDLDELVVLGDSSGAEGGVRMLRMEQRVGGVPVFLSETRFILDQQGRLWKTIGAMVPHAGEIAPRTEAARIMSPAQAVAHLLATTGTDTTPEKFSVARERDGGFIELDSTEASVWGKVTAKRVLFPVAPGALVPAWSVTVLTHGERDWYGVVDAETGGLLWRKNIRNHASIHDARFRVYVQADGTTPADNPSPLSPTTVTPGSGTQPPGIAPTIVSMFTAQSLVASPNGWIDDCPAGVCAAAQTRTEGNNVNACMDRVGGAGAGGANQCDTAASSVLDGLGMPLGNTDANSRDRDFLGTVARDFQTNFLPPPQGGNPEAGQTPTGNGNNGTLAVDQFRRGSVTGQFYATNWYHDRLFLLGFDEASANFQQLNFTASGLAGDRVLVDVQDSSGTDNANFSTPPDGQSGRSQMFRFIGPTVDRDGGLDNEILFHELTHGTSNRLVGNANGLIWDAAVGMGEGWSDYYALSLLNNTATDLPNDSYASGGYATFKAFGVVAFLDNYLYGIRRFPYDNDNTVNPLTWADADPRLNNLAGGIAPDPLGFNIGGASEVHNVGEIWAQSLWEVRARVIADPAGANNSVPTGNQTMLRLVTDGLKATPLSPGYTEARDAILDADCVANAACPNERWIWEGFADRGLGLGAKAPYRQLFAPVTGAGSITESFAMPKLFVASPAAVVISDPLPLGNNNGAVDLDEPVQITVSLTNPWRAALRAVTSATATLSTLNPNVTILDNSASWGAIGNGLSVAASDTFAFSVDPAIGCGAPVDFTLTIAAIDGDAVTPAAGDTATFRIWVGVEGAPGTPVTFTRTPPAPIAIQDNRPMGVRDQLTTAASPMKIVDVNLRVDSLPHIFPGDVTVGIYSPEGTGADVVTFIGGAVGGGGDGDNITNMVIDDEAVGDILLATNAQAPYTGSWIPIANSPSWPVLGFGPQDAVGQLARMDGENGNGTWTISVSDQAAVDTGTLNSWSVIITPATFTCATLPVELLDFGIE